MKFKKTIATLLTVTLLSMAVCLPAQAKTYSSYLSSQICTAGEWTSFEDDVVQLTSSYDEPWPGDVGVSTSKTSVGLSDAFVQSESRTCRIKLMEQDDFLNADDYVTEFYAYFYTTAAGKYRPENFRRDDSSAPDDSIEDASGIELYIEVKIDRITEDTSVNVPYNLFQYRIWAD